MNQIPIPNDDENLHATRQEWDRAAASFDDEPDHGLHPARVLQAWTRLLQAWLPAKPVEILDLGCGTGSLSVVLAGLGHRVVGIDLSPAMIAKARAKARAAGLAVDFKLMNAAAPDFPPQTFEAVVCRHLLWALADPAQALQRWVNLLKPEGRLILVEGYWSTGAGLHAPEVVAALPAPVQVISIQNLSDQPDFWDKPVHDERYAIIASL